MKRLVWLAFLLLTIPASGQVGHGYGQVTNNLGQGVPHPTVRVCTEPASNPTCTPLATIFVDFGLTTPLANPFQGDAVGNYSFFVASTVPSYHIQTTGPGVAQFDLAYVILPPSGGGGGGGAACTTGPPYSVATLGASGLICGPDPNTTSTPTQFTNIAPAGIHGQGLYSDVLQTGNFNIGVYTPINPTLIGVFSLTANPLTFSPTNGGYSWYVPISDSGGFIFSPGGGLPGAASQLTEVCNPAAAGDTCIYNGTNWVKIAGNSGVIGVLEESAAGVPSWGVLSGIPCIGVTAGDFCYWNSTAWTKLSGNGTTTPEILQEVSGVPSWVPGLCTGISNGDVCYWNGSAWTRFAANSGSPRFFQEDGSGNPSWVNATCITCILAPAPLIPKGLLSAVGTSSAATIDLPDVKEYSACNVNNGTPATIWSLPAANPAVLAARVGTNSVGCALSFADGKFAYFDAALPTDWDVLTLPYIKLFLVSTDNAGAQTIIPQFQIACNKGDGTTTDDVAFNAAHAFATITTNTTANQQWNTTVQMNSTDMTGCLPGNLMHVRMGRATDTATNAEYLKVDITYPRLPQVQAN